MSGEIGNAERCMNAVRKLQEELGNARKTLIKSETCVVNRATMQAQLEYLQDHLPDTIPKAAEIVGCKTNSFSMHLNGHSDFKVSEAKKIAAVIGMPIEVLFKEEAK